MEVRRVQQTMWQELILLDQSLSYMLDFKFGGLRKMLGTIRIGVGSLR